MFIANKRYINKPFPAPLQGIPFWVLFLCVLLLFTGCGGQEEESDGVARLEGTPLQTTQDTWLLAEGDEQPHQVTLRFTSVDTDQDSVRAEVEAYNLSATGHTVPFQEDEKYIYAVAHYEVTFPEDYPGGFAGIQRAAPDFSIVSATGEEDIVEGDVTYQGLNNTWELALPVEEWNLMPGETYKGKIVYIMVKDFSDYLIKETYPTDSNGGTGEHYYRPTK